MDDLRSLRPPRLVDEVLGNGRLPNNFVRVLLARFQLNSTNGNPLSTDLWKGEGLHVFLGNLTAESAPVLGLAELTLLWVDRDGGAHIIHSLFSSPVGPYDHDGRLSGCRGELPPEGLPQYPRSWWLPSGHGAPSALFPGMTTGCI